MKLDGYRAIAIKTRVKLHLRSQTTTTSVNAYRNILAGLASLPSDTVIDEDIVALEESGKPSFNTLQN